MNGFKALSVALLASATALNARTACGTTYTYTTLDDPLALSGSHEGTEAIAISGNTVVGWYSTAPGFVHGFRETDGVYTTLEVPTARAGTTGAYGISGNTVVGYFGDSTGYHGFTETNGVYTTFNVPSGWGRTFAHGIDGTTIVGISDNGSQIGFIETAGVYTQLDCPYARRGSAPTGGTFAMGVSGNTVVGYYTNATGDHGFIETPNGPFSTIWTTLDDPLAVNGPQSGTYAYAISGNTVVGYYINATGEHGFLETDGVFTDFDLPFAMGKTYLVSISGDTLAGTYVDQAGTIHGFVATPVPEPTSLTLLALSSGILLFRRRRST